MKLLKSKNRLFSLLLLSAFAIFFTACEKEELITKDDQSSDIIQTTGDAFDLATLPVSPEEVWAAANNGDNSSETNVADERCPLALYNLTCNRVTFSSSPQYAFWAYHFTQSGSFQGWSRLDVPSCGTYYNQPYIVVNNRYRTVGFVGYQSNGTMTVICP